MDARLISSINSRITFARIVFSPPNPSATYDRSSTFSVCLGFDEFGAEHDASLSSVSSLGCGMARAYVPRLALGQATGVVSSTLLCSVSTQGG
jgi:hypothetical protein